VKPLQKVFLLLVKFKNVWYRKWWLEIYKFRFGWGILKKTKKTDEYFGETKTYQLFAKDWQHIHKHLPRICEREMKKSTNKFTVLPNVTYISQLLSRPSRYWTPSNGSYCDSFAKTLPSTYGTFCSFRFQLQRRPKLLLYSFSKQSAT